MRVLPFLGVVALWAVTLGGVYVAVDQLFELGKGLLEDTRTPVPGSRVLRLDAREYNLFFEARDIPHPGSLGDRLGEREPRPFAFRSGRWNRTSCFS